MRGYLLGLVLLLASVSCGEVEDSSASAGAAAPSAAASQQGTELLLRFDDQAAPGGVVPAVQSDGSARVRFDVATANGGVLTWAEGVGDGTAVRTPEHRASGPSPGAALVAEMTGDAADSLSPGRRDFTFSVVMQSDRPQPGRPGDDGDNLVQRGRYGDDLAQYKLQVDHGVPACRIAGTEGVAEVAAPDTVRSGRWYRLTCSRKAGEVRLVVRDLRYGNRTVEVAAVDVGSVAFDGVPLSIGAKVDDDGRLDPAGLDQFHGVIARVVIDVS